MIRCPHCGKFIDVQNEIRRIRVRRGLTVEEAAGEIGCSASTFYKWEIGTTAPSPKYRETLIRWLRGN